MTGSSPQLQKNLTRIAGWSLFAVIVISAFIAGLILRRWAWDQTEPIRYTSDINNAFVQGTQALKVGYLDRYDQETSNPGPKERGMDLDYAPGRLAIATLWTKWVREKLEPGITDYRKIRAWNQPFYYRATELHRQYELVEPMLMVNLTGEILSAIAMFLLVKRYTSGKPPNLRPIRGNILGLIAALFFWFDPALIWNAHCWPQWDSWVMPFFLWAVLLASWDWWFCAGAIIATGAMFKGQILFGSPIFLLWPVFQGRLPAVARWITGLLTAIAAITAVWVLRTPGITNIDEVFVPGKVNPNSIAWLIYLAMIFASMPGVLGWSRRPIARIPVAMLLSAVAIWFIALHSNHTFSVIGFIFLAITARWVDSQCAKWSWHARLPLGCIAIALLAYPLYGLTSAAMAQSIADDIAKGLAPSPPMNWFAVVATAIIAMGALLAVAPKKVLPYAAAGWMAGALLLCIPIFDGGRGWFDLGIAYGTHHFERMSSGELENLPDLLKNREVGWGWEDEMDPVFTLPAGPPPTN